MAALYPTSVKTWSPTDAGFNYPEDLKEIVYARHVTTIYDEVTAIEQELGAGSLKPTIVHDLVPFNDESGKVWGSLRERLNNIEQGALDGATKRVSTSGGSSIVSSSTTVGLVVKTSGSGNLVEFRTSSNVLANRFGSDGLIAGVIDGGTA